MPASIRFGVQPLGCPPKSALRTSTHVVTLEPASSLDWQDAPDFAVANPKSSATNSTNSANFFRGIREIRGEFLRTVSQGIPRKTGGSHMTVICGTYDLS